VSDPSDRLAEGDDCAECKRLWERFAQASAELVQLVEEKYSTDKRAHSLLDESVRHAIGKRQQAKQEILSHERDKHSKAGECAVCGGTGKVNQKVSGVIDYVLCSNCGGSGINEGRSGK
jgi:hypothetical protein